MIENAPHITAKHVENGRKMRAVVDRDIVERSLTFEQSVESLASFLGIAKESVMLGIAIANDADDPAPFPA